MSAVSFATVAEGASDHAVLENIIEGLCRHFEIDLLSINPLQPLVDQTGKQLTESQGGWNEVLQWLIAKKYDQALTMNDHIIVQIDTDICEEPQIAVDKAPQGQALDIESLIAAMRAKLVALLGTDFELYSGNLHFAIAVHSIECWLLPFWGDADKHSHQNTCKHRVDCGLARANEAGLRKDDARTYWSASIPFRKKKGFLAVAQKQESFRLFVESVTPIFQSDGVTGDQIGSEVVEE